MDDVKRESLLRIGISIEGVKEIMVNFKQGGNAISISIEVGVLLGMVAAVLATNLMQALERKSNMNELIIPKKEIIRPSRRFVLAGLSAGIVAPMIVPAASLMDINTKMNRLHIAFWDEINQHWARSLIDKVRDWGTPDFIRWTKQYNNEDLKYELVRNELINPEYGRTRYYYLAINENGDFHLFNKRTNNRLA